ncbi:MAG: hypothetical protein JW995_01175 [Melioribacteraceae bacterium]|nr:hypothetical protein [Melioribacteraceae bacterium]
MTYKSVIKMLCALIFFSSVSLYSQSPFNITLTITEGNINLSDLIVNKNLEGTPRIIELTMSEAGRSVILEFMISWDRYRTGDFQNLYSLRTMPFNSRLRLSNNDISSFDDIEIASDEPNDDLIEEQRVIGQPVGRYQFVATVFDGNTNEFLSEAVEIKDMCVPNENIIITSPVDGNTYSIGGVSASWSVDPCITEYNILAKRKIPGNTNDVDDILEAGETIIDYTFEMTEQEYEAGVMNINLDGLIDNVYWQDGDEIVLLVTGFSPLSIGLNEVLSDPIKFNIGNPTDTPEGFETSVVDKAQVFYEKLTTGQITIDQIEGIFDENGQPVSFANFQQLMSDLAANPDRVISITFIENE